MTKINMLGLLDMKGNEVVRRVYGIDGISPTLTTSQGGHRQPKILVGGAEVKKIFAMRGRYNEDGSTSQQVEVRKDDVTSTLTGVQKDNLLFEGDGEYMQTVTVNDLFCGAGGMGLGFKNAGFEIAGAWDFDKYAVQSYKHNVGDHVQQADISQMTFEDMPESDVWTFGFPCQDLSIAGKQAGLFEGKRSGLFFEVMRLLDEKIAHGQALPSIIMAENVKGLKPYLEVLEEEYRQRGYKMYYTLYNSKYWGVPQNRERYFVVGVHESIGKEFVFPMQQDYYIPKLSTVLEPVVEEKYYIDSEKAKVIIDMAKDKLIVKEATKKGYAEATQGDTINLSHPNSKTRRGRVGKQIAQTLLTGQEQTVVEQTPFPTTEGEVSYCLQTRIRPDVKYIKQKEWTTVIENGLRVRKLTPREYARLQGFPDTFEIVVSNSQAYKQFGNAVTVNVAKAIAERIKIFLLSL